VRELPKTPRETIASFLKKTVILANIGQYRWMPPILANKGITLTNISEYRLLVNTVLQNRRFRNIVCWLSIRQSQSTGQISSTFQTPSIAASPPYSFLLQLSRIEIAWGRIGANLLLSMPRYLSAFQRDLIRNRLLSKSLNKGNS